MSEILVTDEASIEGKIFRVYTMKNRACDRSLSVRLSITPNGWQCAFYKSIGDAAMDVRQIAVPIHLADLAAYALEESKNFVREWEKQLA